MEDKFLCFVGFDRSGSTLISSILDAHDNIAISNETNIVRKLVEGVPVENDLKWKCVYDAQNFTATHKHWTGENYSIPNFKYSYNYITRYGDKKSGSNAMLFVNQDNLIRFLKKVPNVIFIITLRNPWDVVASIHTRPDTLKEEIPDRQIISIIQRHRDMCLGIQNVLETDKPRVFVYHEDLILKREDELIRIINELGLPPYEDYIKAAMSIVRKNPRYTRLKVEYSLKETKELDLLCQEFKFLKPYLLKGK